MATARRPATSIVVPEKVFQMWQHRVNLVCDAIGKISSDIALGRDDVRDPEVLIDIRNATTLAYLTELNAEALRDSFADYEFNTGG